MNEQKYGPAILRAQERSLVTDLFLRARQEGRPYFPVEEDAEAGRRWLRTVLADCDAFAEHLALLCKLFEVRYRRAVPRQDRPMGATPRAPGPDAGFRFFRLLEEPKAAEIVDLGVREKSPSDDEVAELLLNPFALDDLADRINEALPEVWLDDLAMAGRAMRERYGLPPADVLVAEVLGDKEREDEVGLAEMQAGMERKGGAAKLTAAGANCWELTFGDEAAQGLARRLAEHAYGDAGQAFTLKLRALPADEAGVAFELVAAPVPCREALQVAVTFPGGQRRIFTVEVPPEVHEAPPDEWRPSMPSLPCEPIPAEKLELKSGAWRPESGPPGVAELFLRSCNTGALLVPDGWFEEPWRRQPARPSIIATCVQHSYAIIDAVCRHHIVAAPVLDWSCRSPSRLGFRRSEIVLLSSQPTRPNGGADHARPDV